MCNCANNNSSDKSGVDNNADANGEDVPPEERREVVLDFLAEHDLPLPPKAIYRGLKLQRNITFSYRTIQNILSELLEDGYVIRCDKDALDDGRIAPVDDSKTQRRTYYYLTDKGRERVHAN